MNSTRDVKEDDCIVNHLDEGPLRTILYADDIALVAESQPGRAGGEGEVIEKVEEFCYLGSDLSEEGTVDQAVRGPINAAWLKWREFTGILGDRTTTARGGNEDAQMGFRWTRRDRELNEDVRAVMKTAPTQLKMMGQRLGGRDTSLEDHSIIPRSVP
ncbi:unnamed protein product [Heligmosomoides polygyrus]|uniref:Reverse transcriptase domain-containing protein n=1 Tax=Heligmosomoides polygyrus TaxID=6339 RepID=A0A183G9B5_HELPZ|nr:unnamed protein product [Heligmosomoides polygyrus]